MSGYNISIALIAYDRMRNFCFRFLSRIRAFIIQTYSYPERKIYDIQAKGIVLRKALVIGQFAITVALIIGSFVVYRQIRFVNEQDLGFNMDQMLIVKGPQLTQWDSTFIERENSFMAELKKFPML